MERKVFNSILNGLLKEHFQDEDISYATKSNENDNVCCGMMKIVLASINSDQITVNDLLFSLPKKIMVHLDKLNEVTLPYAIKIDDKVYVNLNYMWNHLLDKWGTSVFYKMCQIQVIIHLYELAKEQYGELLTKLLHEYS